jgi:radical SAM protein with 4Fe4S-binding SPASM domain
MFRPYTIDADWIPPAIPELQALERDGSVLCLNPEVPAWLGTRPSGARMLQLVDGESSVRDYHALLRASGGSYSLDEMVRFFQQVVNTRFFDPPRETPWDDRWRERKLRGIYLHLTNRCNLQCSYCYRESSPHLPVLHGAERFCEMLDYVQSFAIPDLHITFSGGEPLTHPGLHEVAAHAHRLGYSNSLLTNATLVTEKRAAFIAECFKLVKISLDGPTDEIHSQTRGKGNFRKVLRGIERLAATGIRVLVQVTLARSNLPYAHEIRKVLPDVPNIRLVFTPLLPMGRGMATEGDDFLGDEIFHRFSRKLPKESKKRLRKQYLPGIRATRCEAGSSGISVADDGGVYPCHLFHFDRYLLGNIFEDPFEEIFFGERNRRFVRSMDVEVNNPKCRRCAVRFFCGGGCHANTLYAIGDHRGEDSYCAYIEKKTYDELFYLIGHGDRPDERLAAPH